MMPVTYLGWEDPAACAGRSPGLRGTLGRMQRRGVQARLVGGLGHVSAAKAVLVQVGDIPGLDAHVVVHVPFPVVTVLHVAIHYHSDARRCS